MNNFSIKQINLMLALLTALILIPFLGNVHLFDWDEINFAECAREMIQTGDYLQVKIDYEPFWEKPPLFIWSQVLMMKIFGVNEFSARLPNAIIGIVTILLLFNFGRKLFDIKFGLLWSLIYLGSFLPHFYFKSGIIDPMFNLFMFLSVYYIHSAFSDQSRQYFPIIIAGLFSGFAVLTKGPVGILLPGLTLVIYWIIKRKESPFPVLKIILFSFFAALASLAWFGIEISTHGLWFIQEFTRYQIRLLTTGDAGHSGPIYYHLVILLIGCFPASIFVFRAFKKFDETNKNQNDFRIIMIILFLVVLTIFSLVKTKIVHYSSLTYYPITFLAALTIYSILKDKYNLKKHHYIYLWITGISFGTILTAIPVILFNKEKIMGYITNAFVRGNLEMEVAWTGWEFLSGLIFLIIFISAMIFLIRKQLYTGFILLFSSIIITILIYLPFVLPKLETHIQGAPVEFYKTMESRPVFVTVLGFKSYAHFFYTNKPYKLSAASLGIKHDTYNDFLINGKIDKPAYFVCKIKEKEEWGQNKKLRFMYDKGGFSFFERLPD